MIRGKGRQFHGGGLTITISSGSAADGGGGSGCSGSGVVAEDSVPIEIPRKFHLQLWIYIYSFLIYAVLVNFAVL